MTDHIDLERQYPVPLARLWHAWIDPEQVGIWFAAGARIVAERGGAYELFWRPESPENDSTIGCRITAVERGRFLAFTWRGPDIFGALMNTGDPPPPPSIVTVAFQQRPVGAGVRVSHTGFGSGSLWEAARVWHEGAWRRCLDNLEAFLTGRPLPFPWDAVRAQR